MSLFVTTFDKLIVIRLTTAGGFNGVRIPHSPQKNVENQASQRFFIENERNNKQIERNELKNKGSKL